jgi:hypothetical protein
MTQASGSSETSFQAGWSWAAAPWLEVLPHPQERWV